ncbi:MAG: alpha-L-fucosidase, partial [Pirellulales bacterium]
MMRRSMRIQRKPFIFAGMMLWLRLAVAVATPGASANDWSSILAPPEGADGSVNPAVIPDYALPTPRQAAYQRKQLGAFCHFGLPTYARNAQEYYTVFPNRPGGLPDASRFNPTELDAEQWVLAAQAFGARHFVFPSKHHDGFCLWPTKTTDYCVRNTPWKHGQGDVVAEVARACRKYGMPLGIYCSPADKHAGCYSTHKQKELVGDRDAYSLRYKEQLRELLTAYGEVVV